MTGFIWGAVGIGILGLIWFVAGLSNSKSKQEQLERELDEWEGVLDVKRKVDDRLNDPDERQRVRAKYNQGDANK
jgi:hypothetical protein